MKGDNEGTGDAAETDYRKDHMAWRSRETSRTKCCQHEQRRTPRQVLILRTWHDFHYTPHHIVILRAILNELSLGSGGEYVVHFLIYVRNGTIRSRCKTEHSTTACRKRGMGTLWSVPQMRSVYPPPFPDSFEKHVWRRYLRSGPVASKHDYDYYWNWEMDARVTGYYYELLDRASSWANRQPRSYLWERFSRFYIAELYNDLYRAFSEAVKHVVGKKLLNWKIDAVRLF
jgi:hypothetical protein